MNAKIRTAVQSDIPYFYEICLKTGDSGKDATSLFPDPWLVGQYYAAPYLIRDPSLCFVAEDNLVPSGYAIATDDTGRFTEWMDTAWLPPLRKRYPETMLEDQGLSENARNVIELIHAGVKKAKPEKDPALARFPAHLHIDLLPSLQGQGCGRALLERLFTALREKKCPGVHLGVDSRNAGAIAFYGKTGFSVLKEESWGLVMGKRLD